MDGVNPCKNCHTGYYVTTICTSSANSTLIACYCSCCANASSSKITIESAKKAWNNDNPGVELNPCSQCQSLNICSVGLASGVLGFHVLCHNCGNVGKSSLSVLHSYTLWNYDNPVQQTAPLKQPRPVGSRCRICGVHPKFKIGITDVSFKCNCNYGIEAKTRKELKEKWENSKGTLGSSINTVPIYHDEEPVGHEKVEEIFDILTEPECFCEKPWDFGHSTECKWKKWKSEQQK